MRERLRGQLVEVSSVGEDEQEAAEVGCGCADFGFCLARVVFGPPGDVGAERGLVQMAG